MNRILPLLAAFVFFTSAVSAQSGKNVVTVYTDDFSGMHYDLAPGKYDYTYLAQSGVPMVHAVKVPEGMRATLYDQPNFEGKKLELTQDARVAFLKSKGFAGAAQMISIVIDYAPAAPLAPDEKAVIIYKDNFSGAFMKLKPGTYEPGDLSIGNDQLSSVRIPDGMKVTIYEHEALGGRSLVLTKDTNADFLVKNKFNDATSSLRVEVIPTPPPAQPAPPVVVAPVVVAPVVTTDVAPAKEEEEVKVSLMVGGDGFEEGEIKLRQGTYNLFSDLRVQPGWPFGFKIPYGMQVTLMDDDEHEKIPGRKLVLTTDTHYTTIKTTARAWVKWIRVGEIPPPDPMVTLFRDNFSGSSSTLAPGKYGPSELGIGSNSLSSIKIPRGLRVTLYELPGLEGRSAVLMQDTGADFLTSHQFNDLTASVKVEKIPAEDLQITIFTDNFSGSNKVLQPGRYTSKDLGIPDNQLSSVKIPAGMKVTLYENDNFTGRSLILSSDGGGDFLRSSKFNDVTSSLVVEDDFKPVVSPPTPQPTVVVVPVVTPVQVPEPAPQTTTTVEPVVNNCAMTGEQYERALNAIRSQPFSDGQLSTAHSAIKDRCLTLSQIRGIAKLLSWDESKLAIAKGAYDLCSEKSDYYTLSDMFSFSSTVDNFNQFLKGK